MNRALNVKHKIKAGGVASWQDQMKISTAKPPSEKPGDRYLILESKPS